MYRAIYFPENWYAGFSGWILYGSEGNASYNCWMIPGTYHYDWDNR